MSDITMCMGDECPRRKKCYRHEAEPDKWQSYSGFYDAFGDACDWFWPMEETDGRLRDQLAQR